MLRVENFSTSWDSRANDFTVRTPVMFSCTAVVRWLSACLISRNAGWIFFSNRKAVKLRNGMVTSVMSVSPQSRLIIMIPPNRIIRNMFRIWAKPNPTNWRMASKSAVSRDIRSPVFAVS